MKKKISLLLMFLLTFSTLVSAGEVKLIEKDELKTILNSPEIVLLDVRTKRDWESSDFKIKGAVRFNGNDFDSAEQKYSKEQTIVLYCA